jgi:hypothetical protein
MMATHLKTPYSGIWLKYGVFHCHNKKPSTHSSRPKQHVTVGDIVDKAYKIAEL